MILTTLPVAGAGPLALSIISTVGPLPFALSISDADLLVLRILSPADDDAEPGNLVSTRGLERRPGILECSQRLLCLSWELQSWPRTIRFRLALTMQIQVSAAAYTAGSVSAPRNEISFSDQLDANVAYRLRLGETSGSIP